MRFVQLDGRGVLTLNYMWLPTWLGMNSALKKELETALKDKFVGRTSEELDDMHEEVLTFLCEKFDCPGLREYLDGIKFVEG